MLSRLEAATQGACHVYSWGFHAEGRRVGNLKIYVRDERPPEQAFSSIFREFSRELANGRPEVPALRPDTLLCPLGWRFHGFYAEVEASSFRTLKFYFRAPPESLRGTSECHPPAWTEAGAGHGMARPADFQSDTTDKENP